MDLGYKSHKKNSHKPSASNVTDTSYVTSTPLRRPLKAVLVTDSQSYLRSGNSTPKTRFLNEPRIRRRPQYVIDGTEYQEYMKRKEILCNNADEDLSEDRRYRNSSREESEENICSSSRQTPILASRSFKQGLQNEEPRRGSFYRHREGKPKYNVVFKTPEEDRNEFKYAEKTTYCRPVIHLYNQEYTYKDFEKQQRLQILVKQLAEAREVEKQRANWESYINELKVKHGMLTNVNAQTPSTRVPNVSDVLTNMDLINNYFDTKFNTNKSDQCETLLKEVYEVKAGTDFSLPIRRNISVNTDTQESRSFQNEDLKTTIVNCSLKKSETFEPAMVKQTISGRCPRCVHPRSYIGRGVSITVPLVGKKMRRNVHSKALHGSLSANKKKYLRKRQQSKDKFIEQTDNNKKIRITQTESIFLSSDQITETTDQSETKNIETEKLSSNTIEKGEGTESIDTKLSYQQIKAKQIYKQFKTVEKAQETESLLSKITRNQEVETSKNKKFRDVGIHPIYICQEVREKIKENKSFVSEGDNVDKENKKKNDDAMGIFKQQFVKICNNITEQREYQVDSHTLRSIENKLDLLIIAINALLVEGKTLYSCCNSVGSKDTAFGSIGRLNYDKSQSVPSNKTYKKINYRCNMSDCNSVRCLRRKKIATEAAENEFIDKNNQHRRTKADIQYMKETSLCGNKFTKYQGIVDSELTTNTNDDSKLFSIGSNVSGNVNNLSLDDFSHSGEFNQRQRSTQKASSWYNIPIFYNHNTVKLNRDNGDAFGIREGGEYVCRLISDDESSLLFSEKNLSGSDSSKIDKIIIEEMDKSDQIKRDIEEILKGDLKGTCGSPCAVPCAVQINFDVPTRECCTEVTKSLSKTKISEEVIAEIVPVNSRSSDRRMTIAINTDPLSFLTLLKISTETIRRLLPNINFDYYSYLPLIQVPQITRPITSRPEQFICPICGATFLKSSQLSEHINKHDLKPKRDCCVCRHLMEISRHRPIGVFSCRYCGQCFTRAYCRELHEQKCAKRLGLMPDISEDLAILT